MPWGSRRNHAKHKRAASLDTAEGMVMADAEAETEATGAVVEVNPQLIKVKRHRQKTRRNSRVGRNRVTMVTSQKILPNVGDEDRKDT